MSGEGTDAHAAVSGEGTDAHAAVSGEGTDAHAAELRPTGLNLEHNTVRPLNQTAPSSGLVSAGWTNGHTYRQYPSIRMPIFRLRSTI